MDLLVHLDLQKHPHLHLELSLGENHVAFTLPRDPRQNPEFLYLLTQQIRQRQCVLELLLGLRSLEHRKLLLAGPGDSPQSLRPVSKLQLPQILFHHPSLRINNFWEFRIQTFVGSVFEFS